MNRYKIKCQCPRSFKAWLEVIEAECKDKALNKLFSCQDAGELKVLSIELESGNEIKEKKTCEECGGHGGWWTQEPAHERVIINMIVRHWHYCEECEGRGKIEE